MERGRRSERVRAAAADVNIHFFAHLQLSKEGALKLNTVRYFVLDECDKMLEKLGECACMAARDCMQALARSLRLPLAPSGSLWLTMPLPPPPIACDAPQTCAPMCRRFSR